MDMPPDQIIKRHSFLRSHKFLYIVFALCFIIIGSYYIFSAPLDSKTTTIHVSKGQSLGSITEDLEARSIIRQSSAVKALVILFKSGKEISRGDYKFEKGSSAWKVALMLARSDHNVDPIRITFKEGITNNEMADILAEKLTLFRRDIFLSSKDSKQGYLFPDTYFFFSMTSSEEILDEITENFKMRIKLFEKDILSSGYSLDEIITMASIIEREANGDEDASVIAGILWKRLEKGMLLQVDVAPSTYDVSGLPDNPIANPGLRAIKAAINPKDSPYLFYLHDKTGRVHYAEDFSEHRSNIARYLR